MRVFFLFLSLALGVSSEESAVEWVGLGDLLHVVGLALRVVPHAPREWDTATSNGRRESSLAVHLSGDLDGWDNHLFHVAQTEPREFHLCASAGSCLSAAGPLPAAPPSTLVAPGGGGGGGGGGGDVSRACQQVAAPHGVSSIAPAH
uniref:Secreted protein n=1 Tax=Peronospora matthiolae TaxID=2874970 RepID=A0AAV1TNH9_9STRA